MPRADSYKRSQAARIYQATQNISETARQVGVHRATVQRWVKEPDFLEEASEVPTGLDTLLPKAMRVLDGALDGKKITTAQIRAALEVVKANNALKGSEAKGTTLAELIAEIDAEGENDSD